MQIPGNGLNAGLLKLKKLNGPILRILKRDIQL